MSGSMMSSTTMSGTDSRTARIAERPSRAVVTSIPSRRSADVRSSAMFGSSSTTSARTGEPSARVRRGWSTEAPGAGAVVMVPRVTPDPGFFLC